PTLDMHSFPTRRSSDLALLEKTKQISFDQRALTTYDKRIDARKQLADTYGQCITIVASRQRAEVRQALWGVLVILAILLVSVYLDRKSTRLNSSHDQMS